MNRCIQIAAIGGTALFLLGACGDASNEAPEKRKSKTKAVSIAKVTLDGVTEELEVQPVMCGLNKKGDGFTIIAGPNDGDGDALNNARTLSVSGRRPNLRYGALTSIRYQPTPEGADEENVIIRGTDNPWMDGNRFEWNGETQNGRPISVKAECP